MEKWCIIYTGVCLKIFIFRAIPQKVIQPRSTKKYSGDPSSSYQVVLGGFTAKETLIPKKGLVVNLSRKSLPTSTEKISTSHHSQQYRGGGFIRSLSKIAASLLLVFVAGNPLVPVFADELPPDFSDLAGQPASETLTDETSSEQEAVETTVEDTTIAEPSIENNDAVTDSADTAESAESTDPLETVTPSTDPVTESEDEVVTEEDTSDEITATDPVIPEVTAPDEETTLDETETSAETPTETEETDDEVSANETISSEPETTNTEETIAEEEQTEAETSEDATEEISEEVAEDTTETVDQDLAPASVIPMPETPTPIAQPKVFFKDNECTPTDDGGYYCVAPKLGIGASSTPAISSRVYSEVGPNGKEIYYEDVNGKTQITSNTYDDDAPSYDERSSTIVWQSLIDGRYQIMLFERNASSSETRQLTSTAYSNTNPYIKGKSAVWQSWVNDNWEIFYTKDAAIPSPEIRQITSSSQNDMFPHLSEKFITWQSFFDDTWHVFVYDLETGETSQITKTADGKYENPRFALLFEKRDENGVVQTIGYDIATGQEIPISHGDGTASAPLLPIPQADNDKALPLTSASTTTSVKNPEKDGEGGEA